MKLNFDVCQHFEAGRDFSFGNNSQGYSSRSSLTNIQCHAIEDGKVCKRNGNCVIARTQSWERVTKKLWEACTSSNSSKK